MDLEEVIKKEITEGDYKKFRDFEAKTGKKLSDESARVLVPECIAGVHGAYRVLRAYRSFHEKYYAELVLFLALESKEETIAFLQFLNNKSAAERGF